ncbi:MAG: AMP-binding protein [Acidimicrobiales bacterium]
MADVERPWSFEPLTPTAFLTRSALVHPDRLAVVDGEQRWTYRELDDRCRRLAGALAGRVDGRPVAVLAPNSHVLLEAHYAVPWSGSPLVALNTRLSSGELAWILRHSQAALLLYDDDLADAAHAAAAEVEGVEMVRVGGDDDGYEELIDSGHSLIRPVPDERGLLSINYTSGTTGTPKGVMYHHRGAYLQALAMVVHAGLTWRDVYLWTLPMFHCNGWCFTWAVTAAAATHVCVRRVEPAEIWRQIDSEGVTALCGAPTVLTMIGYAPEARPLAEGRRLRILTGGAPPTPAILSRMEELGGEVTHLYGLTETYGPVVLCEWQPDWDDLDGDAKAHLRARQGVANVIANPVRVVDGDGGDVASDGETTGEIAVRGNDVMLGYLDDDDATAASIPDGWFRTGDVGVMHPDGYIELRDRSKDVIISGGENISSVEVEAAISAHPAVLECAVIAVPDEKWGEVPGAYVTLKDGASATPEDLIEFVRDRLARFKAPKHVTFGPLPKTSTGKVQKFALREEAWAEHDRRIG